MKKEEIAIKNVTLRLPDHIHKRIEEMSKRDGRSLNNEIIQSVIEFLQNRGYDIDQMEDKGIKSVSSKPNSRANVV